MEIAAIYWEDSRCSSVNHKGLSLVIVKSKLIATRETWTLENEADLLPVLVKRSPPNDFFNMGVPSAGL